MPRIPVYEQRTSPSGLGPTARASGQQVASIGGALQNLGQAGAGIAQDMYRRQEQEREDDAAIAATTSLAEGGLYWAKELQRRSDEWTPDGPGVYDSFTQDFDAWQSQQLEAAGTPKAKRYLTERFAAMRTDFGLNAFKTDREKRVELNAARWEAGVTASANSVFSSPGRLEVERAQIKAGLRALTGISLGKKIEIEAKLDEQLNLAAVMGERARSGDTAFFNAIVEPAARVGAEGVAAPAPAAAPGGFENAVAQVLKHEGGYAESDGNTGAPVNFGINQKANPDIDVKNLTEEQAVKLYRERYWDAIGGDNLPAELQGTALDAAVNQGPGNAKKWLAESGGDVNKFNALRRAHYEKLLEKPEFARFRNAWMGRLDSYEQVAEQATQAATPIAVDGVEYILRPAEQLPAAFRGLPPAKQFQLMQEAARGMEQEKRGAEASVALVAAKSVVDQLYVTPDTVIDLPAAKEMAVRMATQDMGPMTPEQVLRVENAVEKMVSDRERDAKRTDAANLTTVFDELDKNGGDWNAALAANPKLIGSLSREARERASQYAGAVATGATRETDWQVYTDLINDPTLLLATNVDALRDKLNAQEFAQLKTLQERLRNDGPAAQDLRSNMAVVTELLEQNRVTDEKKQAQFFSLLQQSIDSELAATGKKKLTQPEIRKKAAELLTEVVTSRGIFWDSKERAFNLEIPPVERSKIEVALIAEGLPVNDYYVNRAYRRKLERANAIPAPSSRD